MLRPPRWLSNRAAFLVCTPLLTAAGAATTVIAPMLLTAASFTQFALLSSVFTYLSEFDLGLGRFSDRILPGQNPAEATASAAPMLLARYIIAFTLFVGLIIAFRADPLMLLAAIGGIGFLCANGPLSFYRTRSDTAALAMASLMMQFGMTLPRLGGLLIDGVRGSVIGLTMWSVLVAIVLNQSLLTTVHISKSKHLLTVFGRSVPLFMYGGAWLLYLLANRWLAWILLPSPTEAGLFAFGANLTTISIGLIGTLSQPYYPKHLVQGHASGLARELYVLLLLGTGGCLVGGLFCRYLLGFVFAHFAAAASATAVLLWSGLPLGLCAWLVPLVIARSKRVSEFLVFPLCLVLMYGFMWLFGASAGLVGLAWGCAPPALLLLAAQLALVVQEGLLVRLDAMNIWLGCLAAMSLGETLWYIEFS
jgi:hypothetical protein